MKINMQYSKSLRCSKSSSKREIYRDPGLPQEARKTSKQSNILLNRSRKKTKVQSEQKAGNIKIREEINKRGINKNNRKDQLNQKLVFKIGKIHLTQSHQERKDPKSKGRSERREITTDTT